VNQQIESGGGSFGVERLFQQVEKVFVHAMTARCFDGFR
jgi:hypothetical protein